MDFFQHRYYRTNKLLLTMIGQWPYQSTFVRRSCMFAMASIGITIAIPQIMAIMKYRDDWEFLLESASPFLFEVALVIKGMFSTCNSQKMLTLFNHIRADWEVWGQEQEIKIIHEYAEQGRKMSFMYTVMVVTTNILFTIPLVVVKMIDIVLNNGSKPGELPIPVYYYNIDMQKYYFHISMHCFVCVTLGAFVTNAIDTRLIIFVQHGCGLFAAVGHKLQRSSTNGRSTKTGNIEYTSNMDYEHVVSCIKHHNDAIEYTKHIETIYSWCFFFLVGTNMLIISVIGLQILKRANDPGENVRFIIFLVANMMHLYMENYMSQILMDHSIGIRYSVYNSRWYRLSQPAKKLLVLIIMRCNVPCELSVGNVSTLSIKCFMTILQASVSYFTLLRSV